MNICTTHYAYFCIVCWSNFTTWKAQLNTTRYLQGMHTLHTSFQIHPPFRIHSFENTVGTLIVHLNPQLFRKNAFVAFSWNTLLLNGIQEVFPKILNFQWFIYKMASHSWHILLGKFNWKWGSRRGWISDTVKVKELAVTRKKIINKGKKTTVIDRLRCRWYHL